MAILNSDRFVYHKNGKGFMVATAWTSICQFYCSPYITDVLEVSLFPRRAQQIVQNKGLSLPPFFFFF